MNALTQQMANMSLNDPKKGKSNFPIAVPKTLRYEQDAGLPVAIDARSNRRTFYPNNGNVFGPNGTNVIRLNINSESFLDFSHSYLQFDFVNVSNNARTVGLDFGVPFFSRLQIMSGGQELEDIQEYSRLYSILQAAQGSDTTTNEQSLTQHNAYSPGKGAANSVAAANAFGGAQANALINTEVDKLNRTLHAPNTQVGNGASVTYNVPIISGIFNIDKYFPLMLTDQGLDIFLTLTPGLDIGVWNDDPGGGFYNIRNVKYIGHEVNLDSGFVEQMKASMNATGGLLSMSSTTYRYYSDNVTSTSATHTANISCRVKSLKGLIVRPQNSGLNNNRAKYCVSVGQAMGIDEYQFRIGSVLYPQSPVTYSNTNKGETYNEIRKCFGTLGSYNHGTMLNDVTFTRNANEAANNAAIAQGGSPYSLWMLAYDFETFSKSATESGINVADRALPVTLELKRSGGGNQHHLPTRLDIFAMCDCIIYLDLSGRITTRI